ncbi:HLA class II histocompatibility antigen gamma chain [Pelodytes ibericus]
MAEESQTLVDNQIPEEVVNVDSREPRNTITCNKGSMMTALSVFVALLIAGQAVTVYFLTQQQSKINDMDKLTTDLKLQNLIKKLPGSPQTPHKHKMKMASVDIVPLMLHDTNQPLPKSTEELKNIAKDTNKVEDAVHYILRKGRPFKTYPSFNGTILENLMELRNTLTDEEWLVFSAWMQQWFLFHLVQNIKTPETTPVPPRAFNTGAPVMSQCQLQASIQIQPGVFKPQCDEYGDFTPMQCWRSTGFCWCVYKNGTEIPQTRTRAKLDCSGILDPEEFNTSAAVDDNPFDRVLNFGPEMEESDGHLAVAKGWSPSDKDQE